MRWDGLNMWGVIAAAAAGSVSNDGERQGTNAGSTRRKRSRAPTGRSVTSAAIACSSPSRTSSLTQGSAKAASPPHAGNSTEANVRLFCIASDRDRVEDLQKDPGYNRPPVRTILERGLPSCPRGRRPGGALRVARRRHPRGARRRHGSRLQVDAIGRRSRTTSGCGSSCPRSSAVINTRSWSSK